MPRRQWARCRRRAVARLRGDRRWAPFLAKIGLGDAECSADANKPLSQQGNPPANLSSARSQA